MFDPMFVQGVATLIILLLGIYVFRRYPLRPDSKSMILCALFAILSILLSYLSIQLPLFGFDSFRIGFAQLMLVIGGSVVAPGWAFLLGLVADILGLIVEPTGFPFLGFTLNSILACVIPSLWYHRKKAKPLENKNMMKIIDLFLVGLVFLALIYILNTDTITVSKSVIEFDQTLKLAVAAICILVATCLIFVLHFIQHRLKETEINDITNWMFVCLLIEVIIQYCCTPLWLQAMYGIPWSASLFLRVVKACVMIPCNVLIGYATLKVLWRLKK